MCSPELFPTYFRLGVPEGGITQVEMEAVLSLAGDPELFGQKLLELADEVRPDGKTRVAPILDRLADYAEEGLPEQPIPSVIRSLFTVGDKLMRSEDENRELFSIGNDARMERVVQKLLERLDKPQRFTVLKAAIEEGQAVALTVDVVSSLGEEHGRLDRQPHSEELRTVGIEHLEQLEELAAAMLRRAAQKHFAQPDSLLQVPKLAHNLYRWRDWDDEGEIIRWLIDLENQGATLTESQEDAIRQVASALVTPE